MKTLDEVIKALTICKNPDINRNCKDCPMPDTHGCMDILMTDALHYLKEYQENCDLICKIAKIMADSWELRKQTMAFEDRNEPLTWDELKQMEGKPVWVEYNFRIGDKEFRNNSKRWCVIREFKPWHETEIIITDNGFVLSKNEQIKDWQAYRKERE